MAGFPQPIPYSSGKVLQGDICTDVIRPTSTLAYIIYL